LTEVFSGTKIPEIPKYFIAQDRFMSRFHHSEIRVDTLSKLGDLIKRRRKASGLRIDDAAALFGVSVDLLSRLENGRSGIGTDKLLSVLDGLGLALAVIDKTTGDAQRAGIAVAE
jgi:DNA-binding transcriptional regulator YiaG